VLEWDSPGGSVEGVPELVAAVRRAGRTKAITSMVSYTCASAALWVASQADRIVCSPSGSVGSIGVYVQHQDMSRAMEKAGLKMSFISAGKYKVDGNSASPLSKSAEKHMQHQVDEVYDQFVADVARGRNVPVATVLRDYGQGRMLSAADAKRVGLVDYIAPSVDAAPINSAIAMKRTDAMARRM
jgi:signal peptide peptidase SppA